MTDNLFDQNEDELSPDKDYLPELVGEGKKYKDDKALAYAAMHKDRHIKNLERELAEAREDLLSTRNDNIARQRLEELIDRLSKTQKQPDSDIDDTNNDIDRQQSAIKPEDIDTLVSQKLSAFQKEQQESDNFRRVQDKLKERYGNNYTSVLNSQVQDLGYTIAEANQLARTKPDAFLKLFGVVDQVQGDQFQTPPRSSQRPDNTLPGREKRSWAYYQKMRKEQPDLYHNPKTQVQMHKDRQALGREFEDGDWHSLR